MKANYGLVFDPFNLATSNIFNKISICPVREGQIAQLETVQANATIGIMTI